MAKFADYDASDPASAGGRAFAATAERLSECAAFQDVCEAIDAAAAMLKIVLGADAAQPWDNQRFTQEQLEEIFCEGHLYPPDEDDAAVSSAEKSLVTPHTGGVFMLTIRRRARDGEIASSGRNALYQWFFDSMELLRDELVKKSLAAEAPRLRYVRRKGAPAFASYESEVGQGAYLWCEFEIAWGDSPS